MIEDRIPQYDLDFYGDSPVQETLEFHERILEFIEMNIRGDIDSTILCNFISDGVLMEAELPRDSYLQALETSLSFFEQQEVYEHCNRIKELKQKI